MQATLSLYLMSILYVFGGFMHFVKPKIYLRIMPRSIPKPLIMVYLSGIAEIILGVGALFKETRNVALIGIILMLTLFLWVHFYMLSGEKEAAGIPKIILYIRIPLQFLLIYWAYSYWI